MSIEPVRPPSVAPRGPSIRRGAVVMAAIVGVVHAGVLWLSRGQTPSDAILEGASAGIVGLIEWSAYHWVGRRNDGLVFVMLGGLPFNQGGKSPIITSLLLGATIAVVVGALCGLIWRVADLPSRDVAPEANTVELARGEEAGGSGPDDSRA